ncbi:MAG TPA: signal peptidase I [Bacteroidota bacterium]|nr:signal peptidase I [Bacteroidota bacterium]
MEPSSGDGTVTSAGNKSAVKKRIGDYGGIILAAIIGALVLKTFVIGAIRVPSESMETTLLPGDCVLINKLAYGAGWLPALRNLQRGDVIVFRFPDDRKDPVYFVKRCVALGGDMIEIREGRCFVNDSPVPNGSSGKGDGQFGPIKVPSHYLFVLGDNPIKSYDSREWGFLPCEDVVGTAMMIYWSVPDRAAPENLIARVASTRWDRLGTIVR